MPRRSSERVGGDLHSRLRARRSEIEKALLARILAVSDSFETLEPRYAEGLRTAVCAGLDYCLAAVEFREKQTPSPPPALLAQARLAAHNGVSIDTVLRRLIAGHALLTDFLVEEAQTNGLEGAALQQLLRAQASLLDRLVADASKEYSRESAGQVSSAEQRAAERVERLLAGESVGTSQLAYDFEADHLAAIGKGPGVAAAIRALAATADCRLLLVHRSDEVAWAWLGRRSSIDPLELLHAGSNPQTPLALGEPAHGLAGWRLTHRQAKAALPIALRRPKRLTRYADVALLASILRDDLLTTSLRGLYLAPLERERDGGEAARETLRAYFATERNVSSAAALLGLNRHTVTNRLRLIEGRIGRPLKDCAADVDTALQLHDFDQSGVRQDPPADQTHSGTILSSENDHIG